MGPALSSWGTTGFSSFKRSAGISQGLECVLSSEIPGDLPGGLKPDSTGGHNNNNTTLSISSLIKHTTLQGSAWSEFSSSHFQPALGHRGNSQYLLRSSSGTKYPVTRWRAAAKVGKVTNVKRCSKKMKRRRGNQCCCQCAEVFPWLV